MCIVNQLSFKDVEIMFDRDFKKQQDATGLHDVRQYFRSFNFQQIFLAN